MEDDDQNASGGEAGVRADFADAVDANIGRNLKAVREQAGLSQSELARRVTDLGLAGFHQTTIARIESGKRSLRAAEGLAFVRVLDTSIENLAESAGAASLRYSHSRLMESVKTFDQALDQLMRERWGLARTLDRVFPYGPDGLPSATTVGAEIDPNLYSYVEETLRDNSSPAVRVMSAYYAEIQRLEASADTGGRIRELQEELREWYRSFGG